MQRRLAARTVGRVIDEQGNDMAREDYRVSERVSLENLPCRPVIVTLRLGRVAHTHVYVPRRVELLFVLQKLGQAGRECTLRRA